MYKICIDPGHAAGSDKKGVAGFSEQVHNLAMAMALRDKLVATGEILVTLTRSDETTDPSLTARGRMGKGADIFLSMHTNGFDGTARGVTVFYSVDIPSDSAPAHELAKRISEALDTPVRGAVTRPSTTNTSVPDPSPKEDYYTVMDVAQDNGAKHVFLSESGFHDNPLDWCAMHRPEGIDAIADAHAVVLCKLLGVKLGTIVHPPEKPPAGSSEIPETVKLGSRGDAVKRLQMLLNANGARLATDGIFGRMTDAAVRAYQRKHELAVDGIVGAKTWGALLT